MPEHIVQNERFFRQKELKKETLKDNSQWIKMTFTIFTKLERVQFTLKRS